ncbi:MAG TPA: hypothetical protein VFR96_18255, partial [Povalibacter sp.]|nr:hypothetical protein [Povalibacter sp.]
MGYPFTDTFNGGTLAGRIAGLDKTIEIAGPQTKIIPGHEPIVDGSAVVAQRDFLLATRDRMRVLIAQGKIVEQVLA